MRFQIKRIDPLNGAKYICKSIQLIFEEKEKYEENNPTEYIASQFT